MDFSNVFTPQKDVDNDESTTLNNSMLSLNMGGGFGGGEFSFSSPKFGTDSNIFGTTVSADDDNAPQTDQKSDIDWNGERQQISAEWGNASPEDEGGEENLKLCEKIKEAADVELDSDEKSAFMNMNENDRLQTAGNKLKKLVRGFLKIEMGDNYEKKLKIYLDIVSICIHIYIYCYLFICLVNHYTFV